MPTLSGVKAGQKFLKGVSKNNYLNLNIFNLESKEKMDNQ
jgi:hypothetical protein